MGIPQAPPVPAAQAPAVPAAGQVTPPVPTEVAPAASKTDNTESAVPTEKKEEATVPPRVWKPGNLKVVIAPRPDNDQIWGVWDSVDQLIKRGDVLAKYLPADDNSSLGMRLNLGQPLSTEQLQQAFPGLTIESADDNTVVLRFKKTD